MKRARLFIAGHRGMVGSALVRHAEQRSGFELITADRQVCDLSDQSSTYRFLESEKPQIVVVAAAKVGGIHANSAYPAEFLFDNLAIELNLIEGARRCGVKRLLFLGSSCIYPKFAEQPMHEDCLLTGVLEPTNEPYAIAKIAGLKLCQYYRKQFGVQFHSAMPTNLYGTGDNYHPENSHVIPGMMRRFHEAKTNNRPSVTIWGSGEPKREFLHVDDLADACFHLLDVNDAPDWVNVGVGEDLSILDLATMLAEVVGYRGKIELDRSKPDGTPRKLLDTGLLSSLGWKPKIQLREGLERTYGEFCNSLAEGTARV